jgi:hypothetical protein
MPSRRSMLATSLMLMLARTVSPAAAEPPAALRALAFLAGTWESIGGGQPGSATGTATFSWSLQHQVLVRSSFAEYPATAAAAASRHDDLMVIYATASSGVRADYYDNEGHVIRYSVTVRSPKEAVFLSDAVAGEPRFRLTYKRVSDETLDGEFEIAPPGALDAFKPHLSWHSRRSRQ